MQLKRNLAGPVSIKSQDFALVARREFKEELGIEAVGHYGRVASGARTGISSSLCAGRQS
jgi:hypothetical protein